VYTVSEAPRSCPTVLNRDATILEVLWMSCIRTTT